MIRSDGMASGPSSEALARDTATMTSRWIANPGLVFGSGVAVLLAAGALMFSRPVLALLAAPLILSLARGWQKRPHSPARVTVTTQFAAATTLEALHYRTAIETPPDADFVSVRILARSTWSSRFVVSAATARNLVGSFRIIHSGPQEILRIDYALISADGAFETLPVAGPRSRRVVSPRTTPLRRLPLPFRMLGLAGGHNSVRPGDGGEFRDISQFAPGDRLRRIDWKVTARRAQAPGELYVRRSFATADATVLIVVDSRDNVGDLVTQWGSNAALLEDPTSLDFAREAASSIASAYIKNGDRVGFQDLAGKNRIIAPGGGLHQLHRLLPAIARAEPVGAPRRRLRAPSIPAGAMVYVISTFLDEEATRMAELWRASGHRVVAIDVLPPARTRELRREERAALRIVAMERFDRIDSLRAVGVEVVDWQSGDGASPESQLSVTSRPARRPR
ncbi:MAG: hypothetical protein JWR36_1040 [Glaciihabitans sp.]|nr:hypothetical protein [Glaciihabitans sp.]MDQ1571149.1 hypothetical protein [Actinomycetota bacterium]